MSLKFLTNIVWKLPPPMRDRIRSVKRFNFLSKKHPGKQLFIFFADGSSFHGGLTDRFKGIVSSFLYCLINEIEFRIYHDFPFELSDYLETGSYNWKLKEDEVISYNIWESKYLYLIGDPGTQRFNNLRTKKQIHCFANRDVTTNMQKDIDICHDWGELFKMLFKPNKELKTAIQNCKSQINSKYISVVFRFQNLLGDFTEYEDVQELFLKDKEALIKKCLTALLNLQKYEASLPILVTSDSKYFLDNLKDLPNIIAFPSEVVHIDNTANASYEVYQKSFLDLYLLADSEKIYSIGTTAMYKTEFPLYASKINNIPFERIQID